MVHPTRVGVRRIGALAAILMAGIYYLIGLGVLGIGGSTTGEMVDLRMFGLSAGTAFLAVAALLWFTDRRAIWALALLFQVFVLVIYVAASGGRVPPFEIWGLALRTIQLVVIAALAYLTFGSAADHTMEAHK